MMAREYAEMYRKQLEKDAAAKQEQVESSEAWKTLNTQLTALAQEVSVLQEKQVELKAQIERLSDRPTWRQQAEKVDLFQLEISRALLTEPKRHRKQAVEEVLRRFGLISDNAPQLMGEVA